MPAPEPARDDLVFDAMAALLAQTGALSEIVVGAGPAELAVAADRAAVAWLERTAWSETPSAAATLTDRTVLFTLTLAVRRQNPTEAFRALAQLEAIALNALTRQSYGGYTCPCFSRIDTGRDLPSLDGERRVALTGQFQYPLDNPHADHNPDRP